MAACLSVILGGGGGGGGGGFINLSECPPPLGSVGVSVYLSVCQP